MSKIKIVSFDPSISNFGIAKLLVDIDTLDVEIEDLILISTEVEDKKQMIKTSDQLRRAKLCTDGMIAACEGRAVAMGEAPFYHARDYMAAVYNAGVVTGILSACPIPFIQVDLRAVKLIATGHPQAGKEEMIAWGVKRFPDAPWLRTKRKGVMVPTKANEHLADAVAVGLAGVRGQQFKQATAMYRAMAA